MWLKSTYCKCCIIIITLLLYCRDVFSVMDSKSEISMGASQDKDKSINSHQHARHRRTNVSTNSGLSLTSQYGASAYGCSLEIQVQPEHQHRARYLTEGSRGPVKDASQQGYPQLQVRFYFKHVWLSDMLAI